MTTFFAKGLMFLGLPFFAKKGRDSKSQLEHEVKLHKIEQELQQVKDKFFLQQF